MRCAAALALVLGLLAASAQAEEVRPIKILFLGDNGHHRPADRFRQLQPVFAKRGIDLTYTEKMEALNPKMLSAYDGLMIYANTTKISPEQEKALLDFVESGKGFIPLHCASYCFLNSPKYIDLVGAQFLASRHRHVPHHHRGAESSGHEGLRAASRAGTRPTSTPSTTRKIARSWKYRAEGRARSRGRGCARRARAASSTPPGATTNAPGAIPAFRTWSSAASAGPWAETPTRRGTVRSEQPFPVPEMTPKRKDVKPFEYVEVGKKIPNYTPSRTWGAQGEPFSKMQMPLPAEESIKHLVVPKGFHAELFVSEEQLGGGKPICMNWDERGRLWIALTIDYPNNLQPPGQGHDRIVVCEDTKGTGRADKVTVFAEKLSIPTSMMFYKGGLIVFEARADAVPQGHRRRRQGRRARGALQHAGTCTTRTARSSNMQYGLDNWIYAMQGYNDSRVHDRRRDDCASARDSSASSPTAPSSSSFARPTTTPGASASARKASSSARRPMATRASTCRSPTAITKRYAAGRRRWSCTDHRRLAPLPPDHRQGPAGRSARRLHRGGGPFPLHGPTLSAGILEPHRLRHRADRAPDRDLCPEAATGATSARPTRSTWWPATTNGPRRSWPRSAPTAMSGSSTGTTSSSSTTRPRSGFRTGKGAAYETELRDQKHGRIYRIVYDGKPEESQGASRWMTPRPRSWSRL